MRTLTDDGTYAAAPSFEDFLAPFRRSKAREPLARMAGDHLDDFPAGHRVVLVRCRQRRAAVLGRTV